MGLNRDDRNGGNGAGSALVVGTLSVLTAIGLFVFALSHFGVDILGLSEALRIPEVPPVGFLYLILATAFGVSAYGIFARTGWAWPTATAIYLAALLMTALRWAQVARHGGPAIDFVVPGLLFIAAIIVLLSPAGRRLS
jgi:hypothetical protein